MSTGSMHTDDALAEEFAGYRAHLLALAYRLTGSVADAEDAVQEGWLRLAGLSPARRGEIREREAWLVTVVSRICLDRLRSASARRERYVGQWLPEPIVTSVEGGADDPLDVVVRDEGLRMAAMVVLERFLAAVRAGDMRAVAEVLHPEVVFVGDGGGKARTARQVVTGADKVVRLFDGLLRMYGFEALTAGVPVLVNGDLGLHVPASAGSDGSKGIDTHVETMAIRDGLVVAIYDLANPDKLTRLP